MSFLVTKIQWPLRFSILCVKGSKAIQKVLCELRWGKMAMQNASIFYRAGFFPLCKKICVFHWATFTLSCLISMGLPPFLWEFHTLLDIYIEKAYWIILCIDCWIVPYTKVANAFAQSIFILCKCCHFHPLLQWLLYILIDFSQVVSSHYQT